MKWLLVIILLSVGGFLFAQESSSLDLSQDFSSLPDFNPTQIYSVTGAQLNTLKAALQVSNLQAKVGLASFETFKRNNRLAEIGEAIAILGFGYLAFRR
jgi:hypothetical protein